MIYLMQSGDDGPVKIGYVRGGIGDIDKRRIELQCGNPVEIKVRAFADGDADVERALHRLYADCHVRGEWFDIGTDGHPICNCTLEAAIRIALADDDAYDAEIQALVGAS